MSKSQMGEDDALSSPADQDEKSCHVFHCKLPMTSSLSADMLSDFLHRRCGATNGYTVIFSRPVGHEAPMVRVAVTICDDRSFPTQPELSLQCGPSPLVRPVSHLYEPGTRLSLAFCVEDASFIGSVISANLHAGGIFPNRQGNTVHGSRPAMHAITATRLHCSSRGKTTMLSFSAIFDYIALQLGS